MTNQLESALHHAGGCLIQPCALTWIVLVCCALGDEDEDEDDEEGDAEAEADHDSEADSYDSDDDEENAKALDPKRLAEADPEFYKFLEACDLLWASCWITPFEHLVHVGEHRKCRLKLDIEVS